MARKRTRTITNAEHDTITLIAQRYAKEGMAARADIARLVHRIELVHLKNPLDLTRLLTADDFNLAHDVSGIVRHSNPNGTLNDCFVPRFSLPEGAKVEAHRVGGTRVAR